MKKVYFLFPTLLLLLSASAAHAQVQYSKAPASIFADSGHGTISLYYGYSGQISAAYVYELVGPQADGDRAVFAAALQKKNNSSMPFIGFEHRVGDCNFAKSDIERKSGSGVNTHCQGEYRGER